MGPIFNSTVLPLGVMAAALAGVLFRGTVVVRRIAVGIVLFGVWAGFGPLTEPHRLAEELHGAQQSDEWGRGARDTRDVVYSTFPLLESSIAALSILALVPVRRRSASDRPQAREEPGSADA